MGGNLADDCQVTFSKLDTGIKRALPRKRDAAAQKIDSLGKKKSSKKVKVALEAYHGLCYH